MKLGEYLVDRLLKAGVLDVFGVPGDFSLGLLNKFVASDIKYIGCCNELNAAYAADGYARINGIGALCTTYAVGELSAINGVAGSWAESVPVVQITGAPARAYFKEMPLLHHTLGDYMTPYKMYERITAAQIMLVDPLTAAREIDRVLKCALTVKKPVYIGVPADMVEIDIPLTEGEWQTPEEQISDPRALKEAVEEIAAKIAASERPLFIPGVEIIRRDLQGSFEGLTNATNIPYVTMLLSKGLLDEGHPNFVGLYSGDRSRPAVREFVDESDCIVVLGEKMTDFNTGGFSAVFERERRVLIGHDCVVVKNHSYSGVFIHDMIKALTRAVAPVINDRSPVVRASTSCVHRRASVFKPLNETPLTMYRFFERMASYIPENCIVLAETGASLFSVAETMLPPRCTFIGQTFYGSIGFSVGACLGACIAGRRTNRPVVLFVGDGSFQLTAQEISTMIRYKCTPDIILVNNDGYTIERVITDNIYNDIQMWQYAELPKIFGGKSGVVCKTEQDVEAALTSAKRDEMNFIEIILDKFDCNQLLKDAGRMMAKNNNLI